MIDPLKLQIELLINKAKKSLPKQTPEEKIRFEIISNLADEVMLYGKDIEKELK